jgi:hypothetical protein
MWQPDQGLPAFPGARLAERAGPRTAWRVALRRRRDSPCPGSVAAPRRHRRSCSAMPARSAHRQGHLRSRRRHDRGRDHADQRLNGLAAPEWDEPGGDAATRAMVELVGGRTLRCELNGERTGDRCVGVCYLEGVPTSQSIWWRLASPAIVRGTAAGGIVTARRKPQRPAPLSGGRISCRATAGLDKRRGPLAFSG